MRADEVEIDVTGTRGAPGTDHRAMTDEHDRVGAQRLGLGDDFVEPRDDLVAALGTRHADVEVAAAPLEQRVNVLMDGCLVDIALDVAGRDFAKAVTLDRL